MHPPRQIDPGQSVRRGALKMKHQKKVVHRYSMNGGEFAGKTGPEVVSNLEQAERVGRALICHMGH